MLAYFLFTISALCVVISVGFIFRLIFEDLSSDENDVGAAIFFIFLAGVVFSPVAAVLQSHANDLALSRIGSTKSAVYIQSLDDLDASLNKVKSMSSSFANRDAPIQSIVEARVEMLKALRETKAEIAKAKIRIEARKLGLMSGIVTIMGDK